MALASAETHDRSHDTTDSALDRSLLDGRQAFLGFLVKRLGNRADAEDVLQEFCIRVLARKGQLREAARMDAWLYSILRSSLNDFYRRSGRRERLGEAFAREPRGAEASGDVSEAFARVCTCVRALIPDLRPADAELIRRIDIDDEGRRSVAADLGLTSGTLAVRLHRARAALRDRLLQHCGCCCQHGFEDCSCPPAGRDDSPASQQTQGTPQTNPS